MGQAASLYNISKQRNGSAGASPPRRHGTSLMPLREPLRNPRVLSIEGKSIVAFRKKLCYNEPSRLRNRCCSNNRRTGVASGLEIINHRLNDSGSRSLRPPNRLLVKRKILRKTVKIAALKEDFMAIRVLFVCHGRIYRA